LSPKSITRGAEKKSASVYEDATIAKSETNILRCSSLSRREKKKLTIFASLVSERVEKLRRRYNATEHTGVVAGWSSQRPARPAHMRHTRTVMRV
jgi:hypothetical protein